MNEGDTTESGHPLDCSTPDPQGLFWHPWPCPACRKRLSPIGYLIGRHEASPPFRKDSHEAITAIETSALLEWVKSCPHVGPKVLHLPKISEGSEHLVFLDETNSMVLKKTREGLFGESYFMRGQKVHQKPCTPIEYLIRLRLWHKLFGSAPETMGITPSGQIISRHKFMVGNLPSQKKVDLFLESMGMTAVKKSCWLWKKSYPSDQIEIWPGDARADNFVDCLNEIVPIDIRLWLLQT
ncbi:MAG: hypothetical protein SFY92_04900 [Verrucomicrobiae bacterium]|nr:hypothetical protein [Verrucomicrobiae bacterium]